MKLSKPLFFSVIFLLTIGNPAGVHASDAGYNDSKKNGINGFRPTKLFVFGDSYSDTGNFRKIESVSWKQPYGITFPGKPSGRFSDGRVLTDYIAEFLGVKSPTPFRWMNHAQRRLQYGMNFAFGGTGVFDTFIPAGLNMTTQIGFLQKLIDDSVYTNSDLHSSMALLTVCGNDYLDYLFRGRGTIEDMVPYTKKVVNQVATNMKRLHSMGVKKVSVTSMEPIGCLPGETANSSFRQCNDNLNAIVMLHNSKLQEMVARLNSQTPDSPYFILDLFNPFITIFKQKKLPQGGRMILIKHVLATIPLYTMAVVQLPIQVIKDIERKMARFFWGQFEGKPKLHWASWNKLCYPVEEGGLGIRSLTTIQQASAARLWYKYKTSSSIWTDFMQGRYSNEQRQHMGTHVWRRMVEISACVEDCMQFNNGNPIWTLSSSGIFTFKSAYEHLRHKAGTTLSSTSIWNKKIPTKLSIFMWKLLRRFLPFPDCLERFGVNLPSVCPFCWKSLASMEHCLFSCKEVFTVWTYFAATFRVNLSRASSIRAACHSWWLIAAPTSAVGTIANLMPSFLLWQIWVSYNAAIFERTSFSSLILIQKVKRAFLLLSLATPLHSCGISDLFIIQEGLAFNFAQQRRHTSTWIKWHKPPSGRLKLNIDASFSTSRAAGGACLRDSMGNLVMALSFPLTAASTLEAEVSALDFALNWCDLAAKRPYLIEVDSSLLVRYVNSALPHVPWNIRNAVHRIQSLLDSWSSSLSHIYREANQVADSLASSCFSLSSPSLFSNFSSLPDAVQLAFLYDFHGFASPRSLKL